MKKLSALVLSLAFVLSLAGCDIELNVPPKTESSNASSQQSVSDISSDTIVSETPSSAINSETTLPGGVISRDKAIEIALNHAGLTKDKVRGLEAEFDRDNGINEWDVDFDYENFDYSYEINADTSKIIKSEKEIDDDR